MLRPGFVRFFLLVSLCSTQIAYADIDAWRVGPGPERTTVASVYSLNSLSTGSRAIDYHPTLILSCSAKRYPVWSQVIQLHDSVSGSDQIAVLVRFDNGAPFPEQWEIGQKNYAFRLDGGEGIRRLLRARIMRVTWRFGIFAGKGEAVFNLAGVGDAVARVAQACGVDGP